MLTRFFHGAGALGRAFGVAFGDAKLRRLTLAPAALSLLLTIASSVAIFHYGHLLVDRYRAGHGTWLAVLLWIGLILGVAAAAWLSWLCAGVVATAPFADALSERAEVLAGGGAPAPRGRVEAVRDALRGIGHTLLALLLWAAIAVPLFAVQLFVPALSPVTAVVGLLVTARFLAYDVFDPPQQRRGRSFGEKWRFLATHRPETLGLGVAAALASAVPLLNVVVTPVAVVAAARLFVELDRKPIAR